MSRWEGVLIDTEESVEAVARIIKELIGASFTHDEDGDLVALFRRTAGAWLRNADFEDEPGLPLNSYRYALLIHDIDRSGTHYYAIQEDTARRVYDALVAKTTWRLWLLFDDAQVPVAHRGGQRRRRAVSASDVVQRVVARPHWRETYVGTVIPGPGVDGTLVEGYVDLLYRDDDGLVLAGYKTDAAMGADTLAAYETQLAVYARAITDATGEPVTRSVLLFLHPTGTLEHALTTEIEA